MMRVLAVCFVVSLWPCVACDKVAPPPPKSDPAGLRNMAADAAHADASATHEGASDREPNDTAALATPLLWSGESVVARGVLEPGSGDVDVYHVPPVPGLTVVAVKVAPSEQGDVVLGVSTRPERPAVLFDLGLTGESEVVPNVALGPQGTWISVSGRTETAIHYTLEVDAQSGKRTVEAEPNDDEGSAQPLTPGQWTAYANRSGDRDVFELTGSTPGSVLNIHLNPPGSFPLVARLAIDGDTIWQVTLDDGQPRAYTGLRTDLGSAFLTVELVGEVGAPKLYSVTVEEVSSTDPLELEPNDRIEQSQLVTANAGALRASLTTPTDIDRYHLQLNPSGPDPEVVSVVVQPAPELDLVVDATLVESGLELPRHSAPKGAPETLCNLPIAAASTIEIAVANAQGQPLPADASYTLTITTRPATGEEREPNDTELIAALIAPGPPVLGYVHPEGDADAYQFSVPDAAASVGTLHVSASVEDGYKANLSLTLKDAFGADVARADVAGFGEGETVTADLPPGNYVVLVKSHGTADCTAPYRLSVDVPQPAPPATAPGAEMLPQPDPLDDPSLEEPPDHLPLDPEDEEGPPVSGSAAQGDEDHF